MKEKEQKEEKVKQKMKEKQNAQKKSELRFIGQCVLIKNSEGFCCFLQFSVAST